MCMTIKNATLTCGKKTLNQIHDTLSKKVMLTNLAYDVWKYLNIQKLLESNGFRSFCGND